MWSDECDNRRALDARLTGDTILAVVEEGNHAIGVHGLANVELVVLEVGDDFLGVSLGLLLKVWLLVLGERGLDSLHVALRPNISSRE